MLITSIPLPLILPFLFFFKFPFSIVSDCETRDIPIQVENRNLLIKFSIFHVFFILLCSPEPEAEIVTIPKDLNSSMRSSNSRNSHLHLEKAHEQTRMLGYQFNEHNLENEHFLHY